MICPRCGYDNLPGSDECGGCLFDLGPLDRPAGQDRVETSILIDQVKELSLRRPVTVSPDMPVADVIRLLIEQGVGAVLVTDVAGVLVGIFSERDLLVKVAGLHDDLAGLKVEDVMTTKPETVAPHDTLAFALHKMDLGGYRHIPVASGGKPIGVVSVRDLLRHVTRLFATP